MVPHFYTLVWVEPYTQDHEIWPQKLETLLYRHRVVQKVFRYLEPFRRGSRL